MFRRGGPVVMKGRTRWLYRPIGAVVIAAMFATAFVLGYVLHPV